MTTSRPPTILRTLRQINTLLDQQAAELTSLRAALDVQFQRIAQMQAELDVLPTGSERRKRVRALLVQPPSSHNGNSHVKR